MNWFISIMSSKEMSLFCFVFNCIMAVGAFAERNMGWLLFSLALAVLCLHNYYVKLEQEND